MGGVTHHELSLPDRGDRTGKEQLVPKPEEEVAQEQEIAQKKLKKQK